MNFISFYVRDTNIFPIANSHAGGQLLSEFNLRSRESVNTDPKVQYSIGPSYTHSDDDFLVTLQLDGVGNVISSTTIQISPGRAIINGHYVESLAPVYIDMVEANERLVERGEAPLSGKLCVGLRIMYSTESTMSSSTFGSMLPENDADMYMGVQVVILPKTGELGERFTLPSDTPVDGSLVNAHLKLAEFEFISGSISSASIITYENKSKNIDAARIENVQELLTGSYVTKDGLDSKKIYTFAGKGTDPSTGYSTWCDSLDSLMIWDDHPNLRTGENPGALQAHFYYDAVTDKVNLQIPHKQPDGMQDAYGNPQYYEDKLLPLPVASYEDNTGGVIDHTYTQHIRDISNKVDSYRSMLNGKMVEYIEILNYRDDGQRDLPGIMSNIDPTTGDYEWPEGSYIVVNQDNTIAEESDGGHIPSTLYIVLNGNIQEVQYVGLQTGNISGGLNDEIKQHFSGTPHMKGFVRDSSYDPSTPDHKDGTTCYVNDQGEFALNDDIFGIFNASSGFYTYTGTSNDYFALNDIQGHNYWIYKASSLSSRHYSDPVWLTGKIGLATNDNIGGFYNVDSTLVGGGYVTRDDSGHLRLIDYELLASGTLAYQLGQNQQILNLTAEEAQVQLDEYVNNRVAFPNDYHQDDSSTDSTLDSIVSINDGTVIHVFLSLAEEEAESTINIYNIDSRFNTSVFLHISGTANAYTTVNIANCQKIRLDLSVSGSPKINLYNSCLYYDSSVLNRLNIIDGLSLWYQKYDEADPDLIVDGMEVMIGVNPPTISDADFWSNLSPNDNHYSYALRSTIFSPSGNIIGCSIFVTDNITANVQDGTSIAVSEFILPQSAAFPYPVTRISNYLKVTGSFVTAYPVSTITPSGYKVKDTNFTAMTRWLEDSDGVPKLSGQIALYTTASTVTAVTGIPSSTQTIDPWQTGKFHIFYGGIVDELNS